MRLYLPRVEARLRGITAWWFCRKKGHLHTIPCNEQEWDKESWLTIATSHNEHIINHTSFREHTYSPTTDEAKRKEDNPTARSPIVPTGLHY